MLLKFLSPSKIIILIFILILLILFMFKPINFWKTLVGIFGYKQSSTTTLKIQLFSGTLEENQVYKAVWPIENKVLRLHHHAFNIEWKNISNFPQLKNSDNFTFKVISKKTYQVSIHPIIRFNDEYICEILSVE